MRLWHLLHVGNGFEVSVEREQTLRAAFANGRLSVTNSSDGGAIMSGAPADILLLDWDLLNEDQLRDDVDPLILVLTRSTARHVRELIIAGRTVVKDGALIAVDLSAARAEVLSQMRHGMAAKAQLAAAIPLLEQAIAKHYEPSRSCF
jgi:cytosine/adenosine deaminase-related metal-dependent hydrolase